MIAELVLPAGSTAHDRYLLDVTPERAGWRYTGLKVLDLSAGGDQTVETGEDEMLVLPLRGGCTVTVDGQTFEIDGRAGVFAASTDYCYLPLGSRARIASAAGGRFALATARAEHRLQPRYCPVDEVISELRGGGRCSRQINKYALGNPLHTDRLLVCEVLTPDGNTSSYPAHKHDEHSDVERILEELYYYEIADGPSGPGIGLHRSYASPGHPVDITVEVRSGDLVIVPHGYHGPCVALPGYPMYYLNVMAGPQTDGVWLATDDPAQQWIRGSWEAEGLDPRLPLTAL